MSTSRLRDLIRAVRACKTQADERGVIMKECAAIRSSFKEQDDQFRHRNVAKLLFIHMLGHPTHFGQMACVNLVASPRFSDKRIGYLGLMLLLDENQEVLMLTTNNLKNDLENSNMYVVGLGLCTLGNISSPDICRDLSPEVEKLLSSSNAYIRKKAALCAIRIIRKCPDLMENFIPRARALLSGNNDGVLLTGVSLLIEMCIIDPEIVDSFRKPMVPVLVRLLKNLVMSGYAPEHDVGGVTDPFLQVKILRLLRFLGQGCADSSDMMNFVLAQVSTNTETSKNVGNAILYECVQTIMTIESEDSLRVLAINILGRFLMNRDNNIRYVALNTLAKVLSDDIMQAVQRHQSTIVACLKDADISIRGRALELIYRLVKPSNVEFLAPELLAYLRVADSEFKEDLVTNICAVAEKYAPDARWHADTLLATFLTASNTSVNDDVFDKAILFISQKEEVHTYITQKLFDAVRSNPGKIRLVQLAAWCIGEFGDLLLEPSQADVPQVLEEEVADVLRRCLMHAACNDTTREYILTALAKLTTRFESPAVHERLLAMIAKFNTSINVELQQRACEYANVYNLKDIRGSLLERMPVLEGGAEDDYQGELDGGEAPVDTPPASAQVQDPAAAVPSGGGGGGLLDLLSGAPPPASGGGVPAAGGSVDLLGDLLGGPAPSAGGGGLLDLLGSDPAPAASAPPAGGSQFPPAQVYDKNNVKIRFEFSKQPNDPSLTAIRASILNGNPFELSNLVFQIAVPQYMKKDMQKPSSTTVPANNSSPVTCLIRLQNSAHGQQPVLLKYNLKFTLANGQPYAEQGDFGNLPPGL